MTTAGTGAGAGGAEDAEQLRWSGLWIALLVAVAVVVAAVGLHGPFGFDDAVRTAWAGALWVSGMTVSRVLRRPVSLSLGVGLGALGTLVLYAEAHVDRVRPPGVRVLIALALAAGAVGLGLVVGPWIRRLEHAWEARHPSLGSWRKVGLSGPPVPGRELPVRWETGTWSVVLDGPGPRRLNVVKVLRELAPADVGIEFVRTVKEMDAGPYPLVVATGLSDTDAQKVAEVLRAAGAGVRLT